MSTLFVKLLLGDIVSGAMYPNVPMIVCFAVILVRSFICPIPKSNIHACPELSIMMFLGFMSR